MPNAAPVVVLVNGAARSAGRTRWEPLVRKVLARRLDPHILHPETGDDMARAAWRSAHAGAHAIVVAGGDGSVNRVVRALGGLDVPIALLPLGTANDLAHALGIPANVLGAAHRVVEGHARRLDVLEVNGAPFVTAGGLGLAADAALAADRLKQSRRLRRAIGALGTRVYPLAAAASIVFRSACQPIHLAYRDPDGRSHTLERECAALLVANQGSLGGGLALPTGSRNDDGVFELCLVPAASRLRLLATLGRVARGRAEDLPVVRAREARIACDRPVVFFGDGDELVRGRAFTVRVRPAALGVIC